MAGLNVCRVMLLAGLFYLSAAATVHGQETGSPATGVLSGIVTTESDSLPIADVVVTAEVGDERWSARSDARGEFSLELAPGSYEVRFSHPGYEERVVSGADVVAGETRRADIAMRKKRSAAAGVEELVVTGRYAERTVDQQRYSDSVLDILNSDDFSVTADSDVVGALSRVTGVTIVDNKFVYIRGLGERYSSTLFNNAVLPSPDPARRVIPLDLFPTAVMQTLAIQKSWSPLLPGDFSGGTLMMSTRDIPGERESKASFAVEYNSETTGRKVLWNKGADSDWTGFDDGFRRLPGKIRKLSVGGRLPRPTELDDRQLREAGLAMDRSFQTGKKTAPPNFDAAYTYGDTVESRVGTFGWLVGLRHRNKWQFTREDRRTSKFGFDEDFELVPQIADDFEQTETINSIDYATLATGEWGINDAQVLKGTVFWSRLTDKRFIRAPGFLNENSRNVAGTIWEYEERQLITAQLTGDHFFPDLYQLDVDWGLTFSMTEREKPDSREYVYDDDDDDGFFQFSRVGAGNGRSWEDLEDNAIDFFLDNEIPVAFHDNFLTTFKFGLRYFDKERDSDQRKFRYTPRFSAAEFDEISRQRPEDVFADENIGRGGWEIIETTQFTDSYDGSETILGAYLQTDTDLFEDFRLMTGMRYEDSKQQTKTRAVAGGAPVNTDLDKDSILPAAALTWSMPRNMQLRTAWSKTLNRPDIREISPAPYIDPEDRDVFVGNPNLTIAKITNYDLRWEWYYGGLDNVSLAGFYKEIEDPIEETLLLRGSSVLRTYENADSAELYGGEFAWRQGLEVLGDWSRDFYFKFNGTYMTSEVKVSDRAVNQTNKKRRLQGQSDWVVNAQLTYDNLLQQLQSTLLFSMSGPRVADVGVQGFDDAEDESVPRLDFNIKKGFDLFGVPLAVRLRANNLIDPDIKRTRANITERSTHLGRYFQIKLEAEF